MSQCKFNVMINVANDTLATQTYFYTSIKQDY